MKKFDKPGFPEILIGKDHFDIRQIVEIEFATFHFSDIHEIEYNKGKYSLWKLIFFGSFWSNPSTHELKITLSNGEKWVYETIETFDAKFAQFVSQLIKLCGLK